MTTPNRESVLPFLPAVVLALVAGCAVSWSEPDATGEEDAGRRSPHFYTTSYLTTEEALRTVFPSAARVLRDDVTLSRDERKRVEELLGSRLRQEEFTVYLGVTDSGGLDGFAVIQEEIGKFKLITFIVGVEPSGEVRRVAVMVYREARGGEVARRRFLVQYEGKTAGEPFSINRDIINISGATMSVNAMNSGVKKVLAVIDTVYRRDPGRIERARNEAREVPELSVDEASRWHPTPARSRRARLIMGSLCEIEAWGPDPQELADACREAFLEVERVDRALSDYRNDSELSRLSRAAGGNWISISDLTADFLARARELGRDSAGAFDVTVGPLVDAWGLRSEPRWPTASELRSLRRRVDCRKLELRRAADGQWLSRLAEGGMRLDPGGLGKGFAVDRAVAVLEARGVKSALVDFSGCMYALGTPPGEPAWRVAVRDPGRPGRFLGTVLLENEAISSSGGYERASELHGVRLSHIVSPRTLRPVDDVRGAAVRAPDATRADGWSTAATVLGADAIPLLEEQEGVQGVVALASGRARTSGWTVLSMPRSGSDP